RLLDGLGRRKDRGERRPIVDPVCVGLDLETLKGVAPQARVFLQAGIRLPIPRAGPTHFPQRPIDAVRELETSPNGSAEPGGRAGLGQAVRQSASRLNFCRIRELDETCRRVWRE